MPTSSYSYLSLMNSFISRINEKRYMQCQLIEYESGMLLEVVQEEAEFCPEFDPALRCANDWETGVKCPEGHHPCRSNCGRTRCVEN
ncbi:hypothetical protein MKW94_018959 [Papaver nudicaule]|uniref:Uncharacterized protein n=1 Tax=Papaver nudicaule TaxID=74823 RepID=A0AA41SF31_PAPNU|nr:hypothetical protein [Papaver nudicaule]